MSYSPTCAHIHCKKCSSLNTIKNGWRILAQKYKCKDCEHAFVKNDGRTKEERHKKRIVALFLYREKKLSVKEIAEIFGVKERSILSWIGKEALIDDIGIDIKNNEYYVRAWDLYLIKNGLKSKDKKKKKKKKDIWDLAREELKNTELMHEEVRDIKKHIDEGKIPEWFRDKQIPTWMKKELLDAGIDEKEFKAMDAIVAKHVDVKRNLQEIKMKKVKEKREKREKEKKNRKRNR